MKKQIITTTLGIVLLSLASAMYAGETINFSTDLTNPVYTVTGNSSNLDGMNIIFENQTIFISTVQNFRPDSFTLIFFDNITNEIVKEIHHTSNSGGSTKYIDRNVTVIQPLFFDRNITTEILVTDNIVNTTDEDEIVDKDTNVIAFIILAIIISIVLSYEIVLLYNYIKNKGENMKD